MRETIAALAAALAVLTSSPCVAQEAAASATAAASEQRAPRRILVVMEKGSISPFSAEEMVILRRSFLTSLSDRDDAPTPIDFGSRPFPSSLRDRNKAARDVGADCWLLLRVSGLGGSPSIGVLSYDLLYNLQTLDFTAHRSEAITIAEIFRERWDDVILPVLKKYPSIVSQAYSRGPPAPVALTIHAVPGTVITGLSATPIAVGSDGTVSIPLPSPAPYDLRAAASGYVPVRMSLYLNGETELSLAQQHSPSFRVDGAFLDGFFPGAAVSYALPSLPYFARLGYTSFRAGIAINQDQITASLPLSQFTLLVGLYLTPEDSSPRWYVGAGPLLRVSLPSGGSLVVDNLVPWGIQAVGGLEFDIVGRLRGFIEYAPTVYRTPQPDLFKASFGTGNGTLPYVIVSPAVALQPFEMRVGLRLGL